MIQLTYKDSFDCCTLTTSADKHIGKLFPSENEVFNFKFFEEYRDKVKKVFREAYSKQIFGSEGHSEWIKPNLVMIAKQLFYLKELQLLYADNISHLQLNIDNTKYILDSMKMNECLKEFMNCIGE